MHSAHTRTVRASTEVMCTVVPCSRLSLRSCSRSTEVWYALRYDPRKHETFVNGYDNAVHSAPVVSLYNWGAQYAHTYWT